MVPEDWKKNNVTFGIIYGTVIVSHLIVTFISNWKAEKKRIKNKPI